MGTVTAPIADKYRPITGELIRRGLSKAEAEIALDYYLLIQAEVAAGKHDGHGRAAGIAYAVGTLHPVRWRKMLSLGTVIEVMLHDMEQRQAA